MTEHTIVVNSQQHYKRIDKFIADNFFFVSRVQIKDLILNSCVYLNDKIEKNCDKRVRENDVIKIFIDKTTDKLEPYYLDLDIRYEDEDLLVLNKKSGLTVHPGTHEKNKTLVNALVYRYQNLSTISGELRPGIVHRLDKYTSGLMLIAKNNETHIKLAEQLAQRKIKRKYLALVYGTPIPAIAKIANNIGKNKRDPTKMCIMTKGKSAITNYKVLQTFENGMFSLVECELETGRTHQIRLHMLHKNTPIVGDKKYFKHYNLDALALSSKNIVPAIKSLNRHALHAYELSFTHPITLKVMKFESHISQNLQNIMQLMMKDKDL